MMAVRSARSLLFSRESPKSSQLSSRALSQSEQLLSVQSVIDRMLSERSDAESANREEEREIVDTRYEPFKGHSTHVTDERAFTQRNSRQTVAMETRSTTNTSDDPQSQSAEQPQEEGPVRLGQSLLPGKASLSSSHSLLSLRWSTTSQTTALFATKSPFGRNTGRSPKQVLCCNCSAEWDSRDGSLSPFFSFPFPFFSSKSRKLWKSS